MFTSSIRMWSRDIILALRPIGAKHPLVAQVQQLIGNLGLRRRYRGCRAGRHVQQRAGHLTDGGCRLWRGAVSTNDDQLIAGRSLNVTAVDQQPIAVVSAGRRAPFSARDVGPRPARILVDVRRSTADDSPAAAQPFRQFVPCFFMANLRGGFTHKTDEVGAVLRENRST